MVTCRNLILILFIITFFSGCKEDNVEPVTPPNNQEPNSPVLITPSNGATVREQSPALDWEDFENAISYHVQASLDANINGTMLLDTTVISSGLTIPVERTRIAVNIYWRVQANLQGNTTSNWSSIWRFTIVLNPPPPPILVSPANGSLNIPFMPLFDWNQSNTAESYRLQVSRNSIFSQIVFDTSGVVPTEAQCPPGKLITGTQYFWRVNASNSNGLSISDWSATFNFTTVEGPIPSSISGRVTFVDTNFVQYPEFYMAAAYIYWPPNTGSPFGTDSLVIQHQGNLYFADYIIYDLPNLSYKIDVESVSLSASGTVLGIYGCDTIHIPFSSCPLDPADVTIQNYNGVGNINFLSWADTTKRIF
ncbi:MAG TPA: hypothetical protein VGK25_07535 [Ignavibacteria bacterium]|jgi:hypothetical protein